jgi:NAD+--asparagine ADP-ribosyltransferase
MSEIAAVENITAISGTQEPDSDIFKFSKTDYLPWEKAAGAGLKESKDIYSFSEPSKTGALRGEETREYPSAYDERIKRTPMGTSDRGVWTGERGESKYMPSDVEVKDILAKYGLDGIEYANGIPDFSKCSECTVKIPNMTADRAGNFKQCDEKCAEQWNDEGRNNKTDWTARDVANWRRENGYSWHERNDMKTCDLVPTKINEYFGHLGGVGEYNRKNLQEAGFDE